MTERSLPTGLKKIVRIIRLGQELARKNVTAYAASSAFFLFVSLIPSLMLLCAIIPYVPLTREDFMRIVIEIAPSSIESLAVSVINDVYQQSVGLISISIIAILWSAGKGLLALLRGLNMINGVEEHRNYLVLRIVTSFYVVLILLVIILTLLIMVFGESIMSLVSQRIPTISDFLSSFIIGRHLFFFLIMTIILTCLYAYLPRPRGKLRAQFPGAVLASLGWTLVTFGFSIYVTYFNGFSMYGNLTTIIILLLWLYFCMNLLLIGAYVNKVLAEGLLKEPEGEEVALKIASRRLM